MKTELIKNEKMLRKKCQPVNKKRGLEIGRQLLKFLRQWNRNNPYKQGIGLSAIQIGIDAQVCIIALPSLQLTLVNPHIKQHSDVTISCMEGCLSLPGVIVNTCRYLWVEVEAVNIQSRIFGINLTEVTGKTYEKAILETVCVQHELDHCSGILITDRKAI